MSFDHDTSLDANSAPDSETGVSKLVTTHAYARLARFALRRPRVAVMGEFSAGKSSLVNALVGRAIWPTKVTATHLPPCWLRHDPSAGSELVGDAVAADGSRRRLARDALTAEGMAEGRAIAVSLDAPHLAGFDLVDTPGISDPLLSDDLIEGVAGQVEMVIWCTAVQQAWRQSERARWRSLPRRLRPRSVLVLTHADRLAPEDLARVRRRLEREAGDLFGAMVEVASPRAQAALDGGVVVDADAWAASGLARLLEVVNAQAAAVTAHRAALLTRYLAVEPEPEPEPEPAVARGPFDALAAWNRIREAQGPGDSDEELRRSLLQLAADYDAWAAGARVSPTGAATAGVADTNETVPAWRRRVGPTDGALAMATEHEARIPASGVTSILRMLGIVPPRTETAPASEGVDDGGGDRRDDDGGDRQDDQNDQKESEIMKDQMTDISDLKNLNGFLGACLVDSDTGLMLGSEGGASIDLEVAAAGNTEVVKSKSSVMRQLGLDDSIEDILITLGTQFHLIRPLERNPSVFMYVALDKKQANLGMARLQVKKVEQQIRL